MSVTLQYLHFNSCPLADMQKLKKKKKDVNFCNNIWCIFWSNRVLPVWHHYQPNSCKNIIEIWYPNWIIFTWENVLENFLREISMFQHQCVVDGSILYIILHKMCSFQIYIPHIIGQWPTLRPSHSDMDSSCCNQCWQWEPVMVQWSSSCSGS